MRSLTLFLLCAPLIVPASASILYTNIGPNSGTDAGFETNDGYSVTDSFTITSAATVTGFDFVSWNSVGDVEQAVDWSIGTTAYASDLGSADVSLSNSYIGPAVDDYPYNLYTNTATGLDVSLAPGTYWFTLDGSVSSLDVPEYWDISGGPSDAYWSGISGEDVISETFDITGDVGTPEPGGLGLLGCGILALAGLFRRKTCRV